jgi:inhibitor of KinA
VPLFDGQRASPALLAAGDQVAFAPVSWAEYQRLDAAAHGGELGPADWFDPRPVTGEEAGG